MNNKYKAIGRNNGVNIFLLSLMVIICFFFSLDSFRDELHLYLWDSNFTKENLLDFHVFLKGRFNLYLLAIFILIVTIIDNYRYYTTDSKSIYLMKRLKDKNEIHKRSLTIPIIFILITIVTFFIGVAVCKSTYLDYVPKELLPINTDWSIWEALI